MEIREVSLKSDTTLKGRKTSFLLTHNYRVDLRWWVDLSCFSIDFIALTGSGMSGQILIDLGIHVNIDQSFHQHQGYPDAEKMATRRKNLFWSSYIAET